MTKEHERRWRMMLGETDDTQSLSDRDVAMSSALDAL